MYLIKKILTSLLLPPGLFIIILISSSIHYYSKKLYNAGSSLLIVAILIWLLSIQPTANFLLYNLEHSHFIPSNPTGDVIILLGCGQYPLAPDLTGMGTPSEEMLIRIFTAYRLYKVLNIPVMILGYEVYDYNNPDNISLIKRSLLDIGIPANKIIIEGASRDTMENAKNSKIICNNLGYKNPILVTSAYHMKRAVLCFNKVGLPILPIPASFKTEENCLYTWQSYLPQSEYLNMSSLAIKEYIGLIFYQIKY